MTSRTFDFRTGKTGWGHALQGASWREGRPRRAGWWPFARAVAVPITMLAHTSPPPRVGDVILWTAKSGERSAVLTAVEWLPPVDDMYALTFELPLPQKDA